MIALDNNTDDKFFASINDTSEQLSQVTTALAIKIYCQYQLHWWTMIAGVVVTGDNVFPGIVDTGQK